MSAEEKEAPLLWVRALADELIREILEQVTGIHLRQCPRDPFWEHARETASICSQVEGTYRMELLFCAEHSLVYRMGVRMSGESDLPEEEAVEYAMEIFNVFCGRFLSELYRSTGIVARFKPPCYNRKEYPPAGERVSYVQPLCYISDTGEHAQFSWSMEPIERLLTSKKGEQDEI